MLAHLLPKMLCAAMIAASSSGVKGPFLTSGLSWLSHLQEAAQHRRCRSAQLLQETKVTGQQQDLVCARASTAPLL